MVYKKKGKVCLPNLIKIYTLEERAVVQFTILRKLLQKITDELQENSLLLQVPKNNPEGSKELPYF